VKSINEKIGQYVSLRDYKESAKKEFDKGMKRVNEAMQKLEAEFLAHLNDTDTNSTNGDAGTVYKIPRSSCSVKDRDEFFKFAVKTRNLDAIDIRANKKVIRELMNQGVEVPGVKFSQSTQIGIRRGKDSE
jgi:hypothetical protein